MKKVNNEVGNKTKLKVSRFFSYLFLMIMVVLCLFPFYILLVNSSRTHPDLIQGFSFIPSNAFIDNLVKILFDDNIPLLSALRNSLVISTLTAFVTSYFSAMTAYGVYAYDFKHKKIVNSFILLIMMVPTQVSALGFLKLIDNMGLMDTFFPLIVPAIAAPVVYFYFIQYMESVLPLEIIDAARVDGSGEFRTFNTIVLPMIKPAVAVQAIFAFVGSWNNYFMPTLILNSDSKKTVPIIIAQLRNTDYMNFDLGKVYMIIFVAIIPLVIVYIFLSKYIIKGVTSGGVKG